MQMPDAALISGTVTTGGGTIPLAGIAVLGYQESGSASHADGALTDLNGEYSLRARPGETYSVLAVDISGDPDPYVIMTYDGFYTSCSCSFTPVVPELLDPAAHIDFDLTRESELYFVAGELYDTDIDTGAELDGVRVHLQRRISGTWTDILVGESDHHGYFEVVVPRNDIEYRLVFETSGEVLRVLEGEVGPGSAPSPDPAATGCSVSTGQADPSWLDVNVLYYVVLGLDPDGGCAAAPVPPAPAGSQSGTGRSFSGAGFVAEPTPTPIPTPTATPPTTPRPTATPAPEATAPAEPAPASAPDLWWLLWVGLGLLVVVVVGGVVFFVRRT
jgi:hypothetical protein